MSLNPKIVGFSTFDTVLGNLFNFITAVRQAGLKAHITIGGLTATAIPEEILEYCTDIDSVICGEGEWAIVDLASQVIEGDEIEARGIYQRTSGGEIEFKGKRPLMADLDALPLPVKDDFSNHEGKSSLTYYTGDVLIAASRGCYGTCRFCSPRGFYRDSPGKVWRSWSATRVIADIEDAIKSRNAKSITFVDENFLGPGAQGKQHALSIARELKIRQLAVTFNFGCRPNDLDRDTLLALKESGLQAITLGIESMSQETLRLFEKRTTPLVNESALRMTEELGLFTEITFIFLHPLISIPEIRENLEFIQNVGKSSYTYFNNNMPFTEFIPFFKTPYTEQLQAMGLVNRDLLNYSLRYRDSKVALLASKLQAFPLEYLSRLTHEIDTEKPALRDTLDSLREYEKNLNLFKLPELLMAWCNELDQPEPRTTSTEELILNELDQEIDRIRSFFSLISSLGKCE